MSEVRTFFRFCPSCGRRFHIKLIKKEMTDIKRETVDVHGGVPVRMMASTAGAAMMGPILVEETIPVVVDIDEFKYSYKCKHCGHEWSETHMEENRE